MTTRCTTCGTGVTSSGCEACYRRSAIGSDKTHCRTGTCGMTWSTKCAAVCDMRRAPHEGRNPRRLQLKASSVSWPHSPQRSLRKPCARMPVVHGRDDPLVPVAEIVPGMGHDLPLQLLPRFAAGFAENAARR